MVASVEASLKRLKTDRIDIYWAHHPDGVMPAEEIVPGFEDLTRLALPIRLYTLVFRGTPLFVQLLIIYSGLASLSLIRDSSNLWWFFRDGMHCVILALALNTCAYTSEILAGVLRTTAHGEIEAVLALGMTRSQLFIHVLIPSMLRRALPAYRNEVIFVLHATAIAFTATVPDILKVAADGNAATFKTFQAYGITALLYMLVAFALVGLFRLA